MNTGPFIACPRAPLHHGAIEIIFVLYCIVLIAKVVKEVILVNLIISAVIKVVISSHLLILKLSSY